MPYRKNEITLGVIFVSDHYENVASEYDASWELSAEYQSWVTQKIIRSLSLSSEDTLIDLGAGTGVFAEKIRQNSELRKIWCVEPSVEMSKKAKMRGLSVHIGTLDSFLELNEEPFSKALLKEMIHHISNTRDIFLKIYSKIMSEGKLLIVTRPQITEFPFFKSAADTFYKSQPDYKIYTDELEKIGFRVNVKTESYTLKLLAEQWYTMLRNRFMSNLSEHSDEEIESGIKALEHDSTSDYYHFKDNLIFIVAEL
jgi:ubiquinone/menaquinone biosynthesis C-methylase UbiE